ncbi:MAG TPA: glycosyltransferase [Rhodocyclaceae bacterium]|nr:glycosyltransferase [Rhodocyclaceae bacterium]
MSKARPKALISYFFADDSIPLGYACQGALQQLGFEVQGFHSQLEHPMYRAIKPVNKLLKSLLSRPVDLTEGTGFHNQTYRNERLRQRLAEFRPDLLLVIRGNSFEQETLQQAKAEFGIKMTAGWWVKDPRNDDQMLNDAKLYDQYFCIHKHGYQPTSGIKHLPALGIYKDLYHPIGSRDESSFVADLCFVGGWGPRREAFLQPLLDHDLKIYGPGWRKKKRIFDRRLMRRWSGSGIWGQPMVELYRRSRIVLNITSWDSQKLTGQNLRLLDVPSTGAFLLTDHAPEVLEYFQPGQEIETFSCPEELLSKAKFYLGNPAAREKIAKRGYARTKTLKTYEDRMLSFLQLSGWER